MDDVLKSGETRILVDFTGLNFISSAGLRVFLSYAKKVLKVHGRITLAGMPAPVLNVFESVGFSSIFPIYPVIADAVADLAKHGNQSK